MESTPELRESINKTIKISRGLRFYLVCSSKQRHSCPAKAQTDCLLKSEEVKIEYKGEHTHDVPVRKPLSLAVKQSIATQALLRLTPGQIESNLVKSHPKECDLRFALW